MENNFQNDDFIETIKKFLQIKYEIERSIKSIKIPEIIISSEVKQTFTNLLKNVKKSIKSIEEYKQLCLLLGYPPHNDVSIPEVIGIVNMYNDLNADINKIEPIIDKFYIDKFNPNYIKKYFFNEWSKSDLLGKRLIIIEESINCFDSDLCFPAIPILFSQLEGMVADYNGHIGQLGGLKLREYISELFNTEDTFSFDDYLLKFYTNVLYVRFEHGKELESFLSRHAIMHGADVEYGTQQNYIKLILFFDSVYNKLIEKE